MRPGLQVDWTTVCKNPADFEKLVKLLLQRLHPRGQVLDGTGGDGGREFQVRTVDRLELYEAKSFTGRVSKRNPKRRVQVEESLRSAGRLQPDAWHLVVPIDHNPDELAWFDGLRAGDYDFVDQWLGQTWLESQLVQFPDLVRYATQDKFMEYIRKYKIETEAGATARDLLDRRAALDKLGDEIHPHWRPTFGYLPDGTASRGLEAKTPDAATAAPITFTLGITIPEDATDDDPRITWRDHLELGIDATLPGEYITEFTAEGPAELDLPFGIPDLIKFVAIPDTDVDNLPTQTIEVYEPGSIAPAAAVAFQPKERYAGTSTRLISYDTAGTIRLVSDVREHRIEHTLQAQDVRPITPAALLPGLRLSRALVPGNRIVVTMSKGGQRYRAETTAERPFLPIPPSDEEAQFIADLADIQSELNNTFPMPDTFTEQDIVIADRLRRLLAGESVQWMQGPLRVTIVPGRVEQFRAGFSAKPQGSLIVTHEDIEIFFGEKNEHSVHTGPFWLIGEILVDVDAIVVDPDGGPPTIMFEVLGDGWMHAHRGTLDDLGVSPTELPAGAGRVLISAGDGPPPS